MNLLRESNMQLREENKHNFEEWQVTNIPIMYTSFLVVLIFFVILILI